MPTDDKDVVLRRKLNDAEREIERLKEKNAQLKKENKNLKDANEGIKKEFEDYKMAHPLSAPPQFYKPNITGPRMKTGAPKGHRGVSRENPEPEDVTHEIVLTTDTCPHCGGHVEEPENGDVRFVFDIPPPTPVVMRIVTKRPYCPNCRMRITPRSPYFYPNKKYGINLAIAVAVWRMNGVTREKVRFMLKEFYGLKFSTRTIQEMERFVAAELRDEYDAIKALVRASKAVGGDETGWRIDGKNNWLWVFSTISEALFVVDRSRGRTVPEDILDKDFKGVLVNDGWNGYNSVGHPKQQCYVHINRQMQRSETRYGIEERGFGKDKPPVYLRPGRPHEEFVLFSKVLRGILRDAVDFVEAGPTLEARLRAERSFKQRLRRLINEDYKDGSVRRLAKFLFKHFDEIFTFVRVPGVPWHNNAAERDIRPAVVIRKNSYGSRSLLGARAFETLMTFFMTCKKRGLNFIEWLRERLAQKSLGPFAAKT